MHARRGCLAMRSSHVVEGPL